MALMKKILKFIIMFCLKIFCVFPIKHNRIVFFAYSGKKYGCNPKVISDFLLLQGKYELIWLFRRRPKKFNLPKGIKKFWRYSPLAIYYIYSAKLIIDNYRMRFIFYGIKNRQLSINTWHGGGAYKRVGVINFEGNGYYDDIFLSSSQKFSNLFLIGDNHFPGTVLPIGMPRNDVFFSPEKVQNANQKVREHFSIPADSLLVLYAPTWRESRKSSLYGIDVPRIKAAFEKRFCKSVVFAVRMHHFIEGSLKVNDALDFGAYLDMQELLCASDAVITDYSSLQWDFCHLKRAGFLYCTDIEEYLNERKGYFYTPIETWGFPLAQNNDELEKNILEYDEQKAKEKIQHHLDFLGNYEDGHATEKVCSFIEKICFGEGK